MEEALPAQWVGSHSIARPLCHSLPPSLTPILNPSPLLLPCVSPLDAHTKHARFHAHTCLHVHLLTSLFVHTCIPGVHSLPLYRCTPVQHTGLHTFAPLQLHSQRARQRTSAPAPTRTPVPSSHAADYVQTPPYLWLQCANAAQLASFGGRQHPLRPAPEYFLPRPPPHPSPPPSAPSPPPHTPAPRCCNAV